MDSLTLSATGYPGEDTASKALLAKSEKVWLEEDRHRTDI